MIWRGYRVEDFIPFTSEVHNRLLERSHQTFQPWHPVLIALLLLLVFMLARRNTRVPLVLLGLLWVWVGGYYFLNFYVELTWAGQIFGWMFILQGMLLTGLGITEPSKPEPVLSQSPPKILGLILLGLGLFVYPFWAPVTGRGWLQSEWMGLHPDSTVLATLGVGLLILRGWRLWLAALIPLLWCVTSQQILSVLNEPRGFLLVGVAALALLGMIWKKPSAST